MALNSWKELTAAALINTQMVMPDRSCTVISLAHHSKRKLTWCV
jgi:hypothetical protein